MVHSIKINKKVDTLDVRRAFSNGYRTPRGVQNQGQCDHLDISEDNICEDLPALETERSMTSKARLADRKFKSFETSKYLR